MLFDLIFSSHTLSKICDNFVFSWVACIRANPFLRDFQLPANPKLFLLELHPMKLMDSRGFFFKLQSVCRVVFCFGYFGFFYIKRSIIYFLFSSPHTHKKSKLPAHTSMASNLHYHKGSGLAKWLMAINPFSEYLCFYHDYMQVQGYLPHLSQRNC